MITVKYLKFFLWWWYCWIGPEVMSSKLLQKEYWYLVILSSRFIVSLVSCSPFKICSVMKLDMRQLVLHFLLSTADLSNQWWIFLHFLVLALVFSDFPFFECFLLFSIHCSTYSSSIKMPHHLYWLSNTMDIWVWFYENC